MKILIFLVSFLFAFEANAKIFKNQFQKDFINILDNVIKVEFRDIKFSQNDRLIEIFDISYNNIPGKFEKVEIKNLNKKVFNKLIKDFDTSVFNEKKWFNEIKFIKGSNKLNRTEFSVDAFVIKNLGFKNFKKHKKLFKNKSISLKENDYMAAVLSFYFDQCYVENLFFNDGISENFYEYSEISDFNILSWNGYTKNQNIYFKNEGIVTKISESTLDGLTFDKKEILNFINNLDFKQLDFIFANNIGFFVNMINGLKNLNFKNIEVINKKNNLKISSLKNLSIKDLNFNYIDNYKQKFLTNFNLDIESLDINLSQISPEFFMYFNMLGYENVEFDFGTSWNWDKQKKDMDINIDLGISNAASIKFSAIFSGLSSDILNFTGESLGTYFLTNFKINNISLSLIDNSLRNKLFKFAAQEQKISVRTFKTNLINLIDSFTVTTQKTKLFNEYRQAVVNFINGSKKIILQISPTLPVSIAELSPYLINPDINPIISKLNLNISN